MGRYVEGGGCVGLGYGVPFVAGLSGGVTIVFLVSGHGALELRGLFGEVEWGGTPGVCCIYQVVVSRLGV